MCCSKNVDVKVHGLQGCINEQKDKNLSGVYKVGCINANNSF